MDARKKDERDVDSCSSEDSSDRCLKGVMRVGVLAKGLLLHGDDVVDLVVLCRSKPSVNLLECIASGLPKHLSKILASYEAGLNSNNDSLEKYRIEKHVDDALICVKVDTKPKNTESNYSCKLTIRLLLTSPVMRSVEDEDSNAEGGLGASDSEYLTDAANINTNQSNDVLDRTRCLEALAELRHAKWFQVL